MTGQRGSVIRVLSMARGVRSGLKVTFCAKFSTARPVPSRWCPCRHERARMSTRARVPPSVPSPQCRRRVFMAHALIVGDAALSVVLAAWWQLRRSAHLLPHLRRGPSSFFFHPGYGRVSWTMAIITLQPLWTLHRRRRPTRQMAVENAHLGRSVGIPDRMHARAAPPGLKSGPEVPGLPDLGPGGSGWVTAPIPMHARPGSMSGPSSESATCPFPVVGPRSSGQATPAIVPQAGPPPLENRHGYVERAPRPAVARRSSR